MKPLNPLGSTGNRALDAFLSMVNGSGTKAPENSQDKGNDAVAGKDSGLLGGIGNSFLGPQMDRLEAMADKSIQKVKEELLPDATLRFRAEVDRGLQGFDAILEQRTKAASHLLQNTLVESADAFEARWTRLLETQFRHEIRLLCWIAGTAISIGLMSLGYVALSHWIGG